MFIDSLTVSLTAGKGGNGVVAWRREKYIPKGGPAGGNGGKGGSVILRSESQLFSLEAFRNRRILNAKNGGAGGGNQRQGHDGQDLILKVPCGTLVKDPTTQEVLFDFTEHGQDFLICKGGKGGKGNVFFKSPTHQAPDKCTEGTYGESVEVELELKLIADVGLIGIPNAGKSTLMTKLTHVPVKIGAYPFTTLFPNLSFVQFEDYSRVLVADIPGIIADAHLDKGLGLAFLKHIERTSVLLFVIDISGLEGRDPIDDFAILRSELSAYNPETIEKPYLVVLNKIDEEGASEQAARFRKEVPLPPNSLFEISALNNLGIVSLQEAMRDLAQASGKRF
jgi:GTPase